MTNNILREEFEKINGYDVYAYYQDRGMVNPEIIGFCENYVTFLENKHKTDIINAFENGRYSGDVKSPNADITGEQYYEKEFLNK